MSPATFINLQFVYHRFAAWMAIFSAFALAAAYTAQYGFGLVPCPLCLYQRVPYAVIIVLGVATIFVPKPLQRWGISLIALAFAIEAGLAFFHVGVEHQWWAGLEACSTNLDTTSIESLRAQILGTKAARCDQVAWSMFGVSMAGYNVMIALTLFGLSVVSFFKGKN